jgi:hypothetical protein
VPFSKLNGEEGAQRFHNLNKEYKILLTKVRRLERKAAEREDEKETEKEARKEAAAAASKRKSVRQNLPWPFYLNYDPVTELGFSVPTTQSAASAGGTRVKSSRKSSGTPRTGGAPAGKDASAGSEKADTSDTEEIVQEPLDGALLEKAISSLRSNGMGIAGAGDVPATGEKTGAAHAVDVAEEPLDLASIGSLLEGAVLPLDLDGDAPSDEEAESDKEADDEEADGHSV